MNDIVLVVIVLAVGIGVIVIVARLLEKRRQAAEAQTAALREQIGAQGLAVAAVEAKMRLQAQLKKGADWFYWIAGLSVLNSLIGLIGGGVSFVVGLGLPQIIDAVAAVVADEATSTTGVVVKAVAFAMSVAISGFFVGFGVLARKAMKWAFIIGMVLYLLDGLIFVWAADYLSVAFHLFALLGLYGGLKAARELGGMGQDGLEGGTGITGEFAG